MDYGRTATLRRALRTLSVEGCAFLVVGSLGFLTHAGLLVLLVDGAGLDPYPAWFPAFAVAVAVTYVLNRAWTFRHRAGHDRGREFTRYGLLQSLGAAINNAVYGFLLWLHPLFLNRPVLALAAGSVAAMAFNYVSARQLAFRGAAGPGGNRSAAEPGRAPVGS